jgi:hypothetical protein
MKSSVNQINSIESLTNKPHQVEDRILGLKDKPDELEHPNNNKEKFKKYRTSGTLFKDQTFESYT